MNQSFFIEYAEKYFTPLVQKITETINGKKEEDKYFFRRMLTDEYSADLKWSSTEIATSIVAADVVSLDSTIPLKKRDAISKASGDIPKIAMKLKKGEKLLTDVQIMIARGASEAEIAKKIFEDTPKVYKGIEVRKEIMFLGGLSSGFGEVLDGENTGLSIRVNYGYKDKNKFLSTTPWSYKNSTPLDDIKRVFEKANVDGNSISLVMLSKSYFDKLRTSNQGKMLVANFNKQVVTDNVILPTPTSSSMMDALKDEFGADFWTVNTSLMVEKNGVRKAIKPWVEPNVIFLDSSNVGRLVFGTLAEASQKVAGVIYQSGDQGTLISKYSKNDPLTEFTAAQALAIPVIDGVDSLYMLEADKEAIAFSADTLEFTAEEDKIGKTVTVTTESAVGAVSAVSDAKWATVSVKNGVATVKVAANTGAERMATITVSGFNADKSFTVKQEKA